VCSWTACDSTGSLFTCFCSRFFPGVERHLCRPKKGAVSVLPICCPGGPTEGGRPFPERAWSSGRFSEFFCPDSDPATGRPGGRTAGSDVLPSTEGKKQVRRRVAKQASTPRGRQRSEARKRELLRLGRSRSGDENRYRSWPRKEYIPARANGALEN
jgi:hypothetical protein